MGGGEASLCELGPLWLKPVRKGSRLPVLPSGEPPAEGAEAFWTWPWGWVGSMLCHYLLGILSRFTVFCGPRQLQGSQPLPLQTFVSSRLSCLPFTFPHPFLSSPYGPGDLSWWPDRVFGKPLVGKHGQPEITQTVWGSKHDTFLDSPLCSVHNSKLSPPPNSTSHSKFHFGSHSGRADFHL